MSEIRDELRWWLTSRIPPNGKYTLRIHSDLLADLERLLRRVDSFAGGGRGEAATVNRILAALRSENDGD